MALRYRLTLVLDNKNFNVRIGNHLYRKEETGSLGKEREDAIEAIVFQDALNVYADRRIRRIARETGKPPRKYTLRVTSSS